MSIIIVSLSIWINICAESWKYVSIFYIMWCIACVCSLSVASVYRLDVVLALNFRHCLFIPLERWQRPRIAPSMWLFTAARQSFKSTKEPTLRYSTYAVKADNASNLESSLSACYSLRLFIRLSNSLCPSICLFVRMIVFPSDSVSISLLDLQILASAALRYFEIRWLDRYKPDKVALDKMARTKWYGQNGTDKNNGSNFYRFQFNWTEFLFSNHKSQISDKPKLF